MILKVPRKRRCRCAVRCGAMVRCWERRCSAQSPSASVFAISSRRRWVGEGMCESASGWGTKGLEDFSVACCRGRGLGCPSQVCVTRAVSLPEGTPKSQWKPWGTCRNPSCDMRRRGRGARDVAGRLYPARLCLLSVLLIPGFLHLFPLDAINRRLATRRTWDLR